MDNIIEKSKPQKEANGKYTQKLLVDGHEVMLVYAAPDSATTSMKALAYTLKDSWENSRIYQEQAHLPTAG